MTLKWIILILQSTKFYAENLDVSKNWVYFKSDNYWMSHCLSWAKRQHKIILCGSLLFANVSIWFHFSDF